MKLIQACRRLFSLQPADEDFDDLPLALLFLDAGGWIRRANRGWRELSGYRADECLRRELGEFLHIEDRPLWLRGLQALRDGQPQWSGSLRCLSSCGELRWVELRLGRRASGLVASLLDISPQVPQRQQLQAHHRSLSNLLDGLPMMVYRCRNNRHWSMEYVSAGCRELTGYTPEQLIDSHRLNFNSLIHPQDRERVWRTVQDGLRGRRPFAFDYRLVCADGSEKQVSERGCGIYSDLGEVLGLEGVVMDAPANAGAKEAMVELYGVGAAAPAKLS
ncbi:PAS domain-containing protein [Stutzerimonas kirkiae]|uniref:histidine kinase n=1 Tax=Stutzerimonas kirkiae TaxID=2211392 RepID=A0A4Q9R060_9GAMM|nr:PAS domain-containing protein [Stutzerimonas kirkiae]TBU92026.1 diguanylate cyclase [Stutzerimonas kirkiae]TBU98435.1 diguanylate cyclase [Stutzerimonas kirkiae]TBV05588.1 diguanylate cyclase [Stutzerimonas kirkiae]TBV10674.1 diguanylate cyclase [Stutzerimonas kirkiae]